MRNNFVVISLECSGKGKSVLMNLSLMFQSSTISKVCCWQTEGPTELSLWLGSVFVGSVIGLRKCILVLFLTQVFGLIEVLPITVDSVHLLAWVATFWDSWIQWFAQILTKLIFVVAQLNSGHRLLSNSLWLYFSFVIGFVLAVAVLWILTLIEVFAVKD